MTEHHDYENCDMHTAHCPRCKSLDIDREENEYESTDEYTIYDCICDNCNHEWCEQVTNID